MGSNPFKKVKKAVKKVVAKIIDVPSPPPALEPEPTTPPAPPAPAPVTPAPPPAPTPVPVATPAPVETSPVTDPVAETTATEDTEQSVQRKKKGRKNLIATSSQGLGGTPTTYTPTLLG
jgi:hypothetical protein